MVGTRWGTFAEKMSVRSLVVTQLAIVMFVLVNDDDGDDGTPLRLFASMGEHVPPMGKYA